MLEVLEYGFGKELFTRSSFPDSSGFVFFRGLCHLMNSLAGL